MARWSYPALPFPPLVLYVWIRQFTVAVGPTLFNYQVDASQDHFTVSTAQRNLDLLRQALADVELPAATHPRFVLSLAYFRHALKLSAVQPDRHTVLGELILNLAKSLEMLLTSNHDVAHARASEWGFTTDEVEERIIPIYLLAKRNRHRPRLQRAAYAVPNRHDFRLLGYRPHLCRRLPSSGVRGGHHKPHLPSRYASPPRTLPLTTLSLHLHDMLMGAQAA